MLHEILIAFGLTAPIVALHPLFGAGGVPRSVRIAMAAVLALLLATPTFTTSESEIHSIRGLAFRVLFGLSVGLVGQVLFGTIEAVGRIVDDSRGLGLAQTFDPLTDATSSPHALTEVRTALAAFWVLDLHHPLIMVLVEVHRSSTLELALGQFSSSGSLSWLLALASTLSRAALAMAGPAIAISLVVEVVFGLVNRSIPQANVFFLSVPVKLVAATLMMAAALPGRYDVWLDLWWTQIELFGPALGRIGAGT